MTTSYPNGAGNMPGDPARRRRRGGLPGADTAAGTPPIGVPLTAAAPAASNDDGLSVTEKPKVPQSRVLALRMSEQHHNTADMMLDVLATQFRIDKRQAAELMVQFMVHHRHDLYEYIRGLVGPSPVDLAFFTPPVSHAIDSSGRAELTDASGDGEESDNADNDDRDDSTDADHVSK